MGDERQREGSIFHPIFLPPYVLPPSLAPPHSIKIYFDAVGPWLPCPLQWPCLPQFSAILVVLTKERDLK